MYKIIFFQPPRCVHTPAATTVDGLNGVGRTSTTHRIVQSTESTAAIDGVTTTRSRSQTTPIGIQSLIGTSQTSSSFVLRPIPGYSVTPATSTSGNGARTTVRSPSAATAKSTAAFTAAQPSVNNAQQTLQSFALRDTTGDSADDSNAAGYPATTPRANATSVTMHSAAPPAPQPPIAVQYRQRRQAQFDQTSSFLLPELLEAQLGVYAQLTLDDDSSHHPTVQLAQACMSYSTITLLCALGVVGSLLTTITTLAAVRRVRSRRRL
jgi:hypothetical protein